MTSQKKWIHRFIMLYIDGFREMTWGKSVWLIILIKLFIFFVIMKLFFFPNFLNHKYKTDQERGNHVLESITNIK